MNHLGFDFSECRAFAVVAQAGSFTEASRSLGLSQSALTRQIQSLEEKMGARLFSRTTRSVRLTPAGEFWLERCRELFGHMERALGAFSEQFAGAPPVVRVGVCTTIGLSYLPGFFHAFRRQHPDAQLRLVQGRERELFRDLDQGGLDIVIAISPPMLPAGLEISHAFEDQFLLISPGSVGISHGDREKWPLISIDSQTGTGKLLQAWLWQQGFREQPMMEFDHFDLIIHSVALGLGRALVPRRTLAIYGKNRNLVKHPLQRTLSRKICVMARAEINRPTHIQAFIDNILF